MLKKALLELFKIAKFKKAKVSDCYSFFWWKSALEPGLEIHQSQQREYEQRKIVIEDGIATVLRRLRRYCDDGV